MSHEGQEFKADAGKLLAAIPFQDFPDAFRELLKVCTFGAEKYERSSWKHVPDKEVRYADARARHFVSSFHETVDSESRISHLAHEAWNCLALLQLEIEKSKPTNDWKWVYVEGEGWKVVHRVTGEPLGGFFDDA